MPAHKPSPDRPAVLRVMIVDDNVAAAQTTGWMIDVVDVDYRIANSAEAAIVLAEAYRPHVALLDIGLPGMNGFDLCRRLRDFPHMAGTVFIAQTGWSSDEYRQSAYAAGFHHYLLKPVPLEILQNLLREIRAGLR